MRKRQPMTNTLL